MEAVTKPLPVLDLLVTSINTTSLQVTWTTASRSYQDRFDVTYGVSDSTKSLPHPAHNTSSSLSDYSLVLPHLMSGYNYTVDVSLSLSILVYICLSTTTSTSMCISISVYLTYLHLHVHLHLCVFLSMSIFIYIILSHVYVYV